MPPHDSNSRAMAVNKVVATGEASSSSAAAATTSDLTQLNAQQPHRTLPQSNTSGRIQRTKWTEREAQRSRLDAMKTKEREMRQQKEDAERQKREERMERKKKQEERARIDAMAAKMSGKKLDRKRRRLGLTKKVAH